MSYTINTFNSSHIETSKNLLDYDFIIYCVSDFLDLSGLNIFYQLCSKTHTNQHLYNFKNHIKNYTKNNIKQLCDYMILPKVISLNVNVVDILNENNYVHKFIKYPNIFMQNIISVTNDCNHNITNSKNIICDICKFTQSLYISHINGDKIFNNMNVESSFLTSLMMTLYH
jgi:hypothetical protein